MSVSIRPEMFMSISPCVCVCARVLMFVCVCERLHGVSGQNDQDKTSPT